MKIKTYQGEILTVVSSTYRDISSTNSPYYSNVYKVEAKPAIGNYKCFRYIPMMEVVAIQDDFGNWFDRRD